MLIVHLFVSYAHVDLCHLLSSSWCEGLSATSAYGSSWTFLFTFFKASLSVSVQVINVHGLNMMFSSVSWLH